jgi:hypothetical protein
MWFTAAIVQAGACGADWLVTLASLPAQLTIAVAGGLISEESQSAVRAQLCVAVTGGDRAVLSSPSSRAVTDSIGLVLLYAVSTITVGSVTSLVLTAKPPEASITVAAESILYPHTGTVSPARVWFTVPDLAVVSSVSIITITCTLASSPHGLPSPSAGLIFTLVCFTVVSLVACIALTSGVVVVVVVETFHLTLSVSRAYRPAAGLLSLFDALFMLVNFLRSQVLGFL